MRTRLHELDCICRQNCHYLLAFAFKYWYALQINKLLQYKSRNHLWIKVYKWKICKNEIKTFSKLASRLRSFKNHFGVCALGNCFDANERFKKNKFSRDYRVWVGQLQLSTLLSLLPELSPNTHLKVIKLYVSQHPDCLSSLINWKCRI